MENEYTVTVTNKFQLELDESEDPLEVLKVREQEKEAKKKERNSEKENKSKQQQQQQTQQTQQQQQQQQQQQSDTQKSAGNKTQKNRVIKETQQPPSKVQDSKKDSGEKKPPQSRATGGDRNVKFFAESREERNNRRNREDGERTSRGQDFRRGPSGEGRETREFRSSTDTQRGEYGERRGRGGLRGMSRGRGGPRGRGGFDNRGKREFDRQSGSDKTGIKPVDKKDGAGSHNWGTHNDEIEVCLQQDSSDWTNDKSDADVPPASTEVKEGETSIDNVIVEEKPVEEESRELTLDEWKALRSNRAKPQYNLRKAGEGEDLSRWKKMYALEKKKEGADEEEEDEEEYDAAVEYPQRVGRQKRVLGIEIQFSDSRRGSGGRGRGGRGRGERANNRGFGNRGALRDGDSRISVLSSLQNEQRSPRGRQNAPKVDDENDFPSLG